MIDSQSNFKYKQKYIFKIYNYGNFKKLANEVFALMSTVVDFNKDI
jgi:hypothetical protein